MLVITLGVLWMMMQEQLATFVHASEDVLVNQHEACKHASVRKEVEKF